MGKNISIRGAEIEESAVANFRSPREAKQRKNRRQTVGTRTGGGRVGARPLDRVSHECSEQSDHNQQLARENIKQSDFSHT